ncbi:hypothetical protein [Natrialbaceae archaeon AArc-T1-2]|uniref:hypothetical protein n=1 Tax=Natrialbaceae archaeon AArc-T1-2 TaxID=3053904 RepID=UPI00255AE73A|nr:hypothetical protein [Natrialbaceae archaeon AArc-T1-2]WIV65739.1 hypothetical protein QQ977_08465 [Natrialbaceae archaeon AArc-T1-2]
MSDDELEPIAHALDRATGLEDEAALAVLESARDDVHELRTEPAVDETRRQALADRLDQRIREVGEREAYDSELGAAMNPDDEDAP